MRFKVASDEMEFAMRMIGAASLVAMCGMLACAPAQADSVPPFKGNDTGGIIAYSLAHAGRCPPARGRPLRLLRQGGEIPRACRPHYGGYISFACRWVPYGAAERPLRTLY